MVGCFDVSRAVWVVWICEAVFCVDGASEVIERGLCCFAGRSDVEGFLAGEFDAGCNEVEFVMSCVRVSDPEDVVLVFLEASEGEAFEAIDDLVFLFGGDCFAGGEAEDA